MLLPVAGALGLLLLAAIGCGGAHGVAEGDVGAGAFAVSDGAPEVVRSAGADRVRITFAEAASERLRAISLYLPTDRALPLEQPISLGTKGSGLPWLELAEGALERTQRRDGVEVVNAPDAEVKTARAGTVTLSSVGDPWAGRFSATFPGGGKVEGSFVAVELDEAR